MNRQLLSVLDTSSHHFDKNGIFVNNKLVKYKDNKTIQAWNNIYNFGLKELIRDREDFDITKLSDTISQIEKHFSFSQKTVYLEIGCGPSHIGEYILKNNKGLFIGIDTNYSILTVVKKYFESKGYKNFLFIHEDIREIPIKENSIDLIYGGGVIEHFRDILEVIIESVRVTKIGGGIFNTVPAFNLWWLLRFYNNIPYWKNLRGLFEAIHEKIFKGRILEKYFGYELSFTRKQLIDLYKKSGLTNILTGPFVFHASRIRMKSNLLGKAFYKVQNNDKTSAVYYVYGIKK